MHIIALSGSLHGTKTRTVLEKIVEALQDKEPEWQIHLVDLQNYSLDFADGRDFEDYNDDTKRLIDLINQADAFLIGTPVYQASIPGSLKNVFDLLPKYALKDKTAAILCTAGSSRHFLMPEYQLKPILHFLEANVLPKYVYIENRNFEADGTIHDADVLVRLVVFANEFHAFVSLNAEKEIDPWNLAFYGDS